MQIDQIAEYRYPSLVHLETVLLDNFDIDVHVHRCCMIFGEGPYEGKCLSTSSLTLAKQAL